MLVMVFAAPIKVARAQQGSQVSTSSPDTDAAAHSAVAPSGARGDSRYRIGPGDVLELRVLRAPELSLEAIRVDQRGLIRVPMVEADVPAACRTERELEKEITTLYLKYKRNPHVTVYVKEFNSRPVAVIGAVNSPGRFELKRRIRLLELLAFVNGPSGNAGKNIQLVRDATAVSRCKELKTAEAEVASLSDSDELSGLSVYSLKDTLQGNEKANPYVEPGDIVYLPGAEQAYIIGNVLRPQPILLNEPVTVSRAIAMAGGTLPATKSDKIRIVRQEPGGTNKTEILVDLAAIKKNRARDVIIQPGDIIDVPTSGTKTLLRSLMGTIVPTATQLPVRIIP